MTVFTLLVSPRKSSRSRFHDVGNDGAGVARRWNAGRDLPGVGSEGWHGDETLDPVCTSSANWCPERWPTTSQCLGETQSRCPTVLRPSTPRCWYRLWLTAYAVCSPKSRLKPGDTLLVQGRSGGMSTALIQMGTAAGFKVWVTTRNEEGLRSAVGLVQMPCSRPTRHSPRG